MNGTLCETLVRCRALSRGSEYHILSFTYVGQTKSLEHMRNGREIFEAIDVEPVGPFSDLGLKLVEER